MPTGVYVRTEAHRKAKTKHEFCSIKGCNGKHMAFSLCEKHYKKEYHQNNRDKALKRMAKYRENNKEYIKRCLKQWYQDNKEYAKERVNEYRLSNPERKRAMDKAYHEGNKEQIAKRNKQWRQTPAGKASSHNRRTLTKDLTKETVQRVYEDNIKKYGTLTCYLCFKPIEFGNDSLEHSTPLSRGGGNDYENLGVAHLICNIKKHTKTLDEWFEVIKELS